MKKIKQITIEVLPDYDVDLSYLGTFSNTKESEFSINHHENEGGSNTYKWFNPQKGACETIEQAMQDYNRMMDYERGNWWSQGIKATAEIHTSDDGKHWLINHISSGGLYGIESDDDDDYIETIREEQVDDVKALLLEFGFSQDEINNAEIIDK